MTTSIVTPCITREPYCYTIKSNLEGLNEIFFACITKTSSIILVFNNQKTKQAMEKYFTNDYAPSGFIPKSEKEAKKITDDHCFEYRLNFYLDLPARPLPYFGFIQEALALFERTLPSKKEPRDIRLITVFPRIEPN